jgi:hypothetical protein
MAGLLPGRTPRRPLKAACSLEEHLLDNIRAEEKGLSGLQVGDASGFGFCTQPRNGDAKAPGHLTDRK